MSNQIEQLNSELEASYRRITVILDPHIRVSEDYQVYSNSIQLKDQVQPEGNMTNIFVRTPEFQNYYGWCWSGNVTYMEFLNENAQEYCGTQLKCKNFKGSNYLYFFRNDMNEPSVFSTDSHTMPIDMVHWKADGRSFEHRD